MRLKMSARLRASVCLLSPKEQEGLRSGRTTDARVGGFTSSSCTTGPCRGEAVIITPIVMDIPGHGLKKQGQKGEGSWVGSRGVSIKTTKNCESGVTEASGRHATPPKCDRGEYWRVAQCPGMTSHETQSTCRPRPITSDATDTRGNTFGDVVRSPLLTPLQTPR